MSQVTKIILQIPKNKVNKLFYLTSRKANLSIIMISQNVFAQGKFALTIRRQFQYLIGKGSFNNYVNS